MKIAPILASFLATAAATPFTVCTGVVDKLGVDSVTVSPEPVRVGQSVSVHVHGRSTVPLSGKYERLLIN
jgi:hypothetical protein